MTAEQIAKAVIGYRTVHNCSTEEALAEIQCLLANSGCVTAPLAAAVLQQEAGEPVAWQFSVSFWSRYESIPETLRADARPLYAAPQVSPPQARVPLTEEQKLALFQEACDVTFTVWSDFIAGIDAAERAHLIGLETKGDGNG